MRMRTLSDTERSRHDSEIQYRTGLNDKDREVSSAHWLILVGFDHRSQLHTKEITSYNPADCAPHGRESDDSESLDEVIP